MLCVNAPLLAILPPTSKLPLGADKVPLASIVSELSRSRVPLLSDNAALPTNVPSYVVPVPVSLAVDPVPSSILYQWSGVTL